MFSKIKKIRTKILLPSLAILFAALLFTGVFSAYLNYTSTIKTLKQTLTEAATIAANQVTAELKQYKMITEELAGIVVNVKPEEVVGLMAGAQKRHGLDSISISMPDGTLAITHEDISQFDFFKIPRDKGITYVSEPIMNADGQSMTIYISSPILTNGRFDGVVFIGLDAKKLTDIVANISVGDSGNAAIIDKNGVTLAYNDYSIVLTGYCTNEEQKKDPALTRLAALERDLMAGNAGFGEYSYGGQNKFMAYAPVAQTNGWGIYVTVTQAEFMQAAFISLLASGIVTAVFMLLASFLLAGLARSISRPIIEVKHAATEMAKGNYDVEITYQANDETGLLANSMRQMITTTKAVILDTARGLGQVADGNFNIRPQTEYIGVFQGIEVALVKIITGLSSTMRKIKEASEQVASGSEQVAGGAQGLAQGATEQASAVQQLSATMSEISQQIQNNADHAATANQLAVNAGEGLRTSNRQMAEMISAMDEISSSSDQISKIIKTIEDIAFQTNILALNAAVEAARAGEAGKGFAVVADEVRNLATKSSEAAKQTNVLIEGSILSVEHGVKIAGATAQSLAEVVVGAESVVELVSKISQASAVQSVSITQINQGIDQISSVVQTNSATSEQSAAASEELNAQAKVMKKLVDRFSLVSEDATAPMQNMGAIAPDSRPTKKLAQTSKY